MQERIVFHTNYYTSNYDRAIMNQSLKKNIVWANHNLVTDSVFAETHLILCRNVLIYFDVESKKQILAKVRRILRPDGYLFLGGAETTLHLDDAFERVQFDLAGCYRLVNKGS